MPRDLFGDVTTPSVSVGSRKWYTVPLSLAAHVAIIIPVVLVPLMATDVLPMPREYNVFIGGVDPPEPPPPPAAPRTTETKPQPNPNVAPTEPPQEIVPEKNLPGFETDVSTTIGVGLVPGGIDTVVPDLPPPALPAVPREPLRVGGVIRPPQRLRNAVPVYPPIAQSARVQGTVILEALIAADGKVQNVRVMRSIPLLDQAAIDAVKQWEYAPTLLNGVPVPVLMTVTVTFTLNP